MLVRAAVNEVFCFFQHSLTRAFLFSFFFGMSSLLSSSAFAQVNGPGTSASSLFDTVINMPADMSSLPNFTDLGVAGETIQLNVEDGGTVGSSFEANVGSEVNINGGSVGTFEANAGSEVNISGGTLARFSARTGSHVTISGGSFFNTTSANTGSNVEFVGGDFQFNGNDINSSTFSLFSFNPGVFTATLADGSIFIASSQFNGSSTSSLANVRLTQSSTLPAPSLTPIIVDGAATNVPAGLRPDQTLILRGGGELGNNFFVVGGSTLNVEGGVVGNGARVVGSQMNVTGGLVGFDFEVLNGAEVNISGGKIENLDAGADSVVNISGGLVGPFANARSGSQVNISGGVVDGFFTAISGSDVNVSGGMLVSRFRAQPGSDVELIGGEFQLNGNNFTSDTLTLNPDDVFSGTLADGTTFIFSTENDDTLTGVTITAPSNLLPSGTRRITVDGASASSPSGLRPGQTLSLLPGGQLDEEFTVVDSTLNIEGGILGDRGEVVSGEVNLRGGTLGNSFDAFLGSVVNIGGGQLGDDFNALSGSQVNISGGSLGDRFGANSGSEVNLFGSEFRLNGVDITEQASDGAYTILDRNVELAGVLLDGSSFSFRLSSGDNGFTDFFEAGATLTVSLSEPTLLGDCNQDGVVDFLDISPFITVLSTGEYLEQADVNRDDVVDFLDISPFILILSSN